MSNNISILKGAGRPLSLICRVMIFISIAISFSLFCIGNLVMNAIQQHFKAQDVDELVVIVNTIERGLKECSTNHDEMTQSLSEAISGHHGVYFQVWDLNNQLIYSSPEFSYAQPASPLQIKYENYADHLFHVHTNGKHVRGVSTLFNLDKKKYAIVAAVDMGFHLQFITKFEGTLWVILIIAGIMTLLAAWWAIHQGHAPLRELSETLQNIQIGNLDKRIDTQTVPKELLPLVIAFNQMMDRLEDSFVRLSNFSADIAHELRTPLTTLITQTQVGLGKPRNPKEYQEMMYSNLEELERLTKMVNDMLWLAKSENGLLRLEMECLNLSHEVAETADFFEALADEKKITLKVSGDSIVFYGDKAMLRRAISNLLSNAIRYTSQGEIIELITYQTEKNIFLKVKNPGKVIASEHLNKVFDRFYRVDTSRRRQDEGAGLGLAIVKSIINAHQGVIKVESSDGMTSFEISFLKNC